VVSVAVGVVTSVSKKDPAGTWRGGGDPQQKLRGTQRSVIESLRFAQVRRKPWVRRV